MHIFYQSKFMNTISITTTKQVSYSKEQGCTYRVKSKGTVLVLGVLKFEVRT